MKKRVLSLVLSLAMMLTMLPATVWAEEDVTTLATVADTEIAVVSGGNEADNDALFMDYLYRLAGADQTEVQSFMVDRLDSDDYETISHPAMMTASNFSPTSAAFYSKLKERVEAIAAGGGSTVVNIVFSKTYTAEELNVPRVNIMEGVSGAMERFHQDTGISYTQNGNLFSLGDDLDTEAVLNEIVFTDPISLYWYDKTVGSYIQKGYRYSWDKTVDAPKEITIEVNAAYYMCVAKEFRPNPAGYYQLDGVDYYCEVDGSKTTAAKSAVAAAQGVVEKNKNGSDSEKLRAYLDYICGAVSYNSAALSNTPYGNPWQLIYVFDNKSSTNVVCEGYAKAFKFLCDLSTWSDPDFDCYLVTGTMIGGTGEGPHMWNIIHIRDAKNPNGGNFMVDPTNCDEGMVGDNYGLFLKGNSTSEDVVRINKNTGNSYNSLTYTFTFGNQSIDFGYDDDTQALYGIDELTLAAQDYEEPVQQPRLMWRNNHYDWEGENRITTYELWDEVNVSKGRVIEGQFVFGTEEAYETLDPQTLTYDGPMVLKPREEDTTDLALEAVAFGTMTVTYQHEDENYTLPVTVGLPDVGFYSQPTASEENFLTEWRYDGSNTVYLVWPQGATDVTILPDEHSRTKATATMADGCATITITDLQEDDVAFEMSYQLSGNEVRTQAHLHVVDVRPGLGFYQARNGESGFARENGAALNRSFGTVGKGSHREVQFVITGEEETVVPLSDLIYDEDYIEVIDRGNNCVELAFNKFGDTALSVTVGEATYTMPITIGLPTLGFYSSPEATEDTYLNEWIYTGEDAVIYLICQNGTLTEVTGADDNASGVSATILEGGKAAEIRLTKLPEGHLDVRAAYTRDDGVPDHGDAGVGFLMPQLVVDLSLPEGVSDAAVILWDKEGTAALEPQPEMRRIGSMAVFPNVDPGEYRLTVEQQGCATRTYAIAVAQGKVTVVDAVVTALGDLNGSGKTDISDMACLYDWLYLGEYTGALAAERDYFRAVADVNEDGLVNILDYQALYEMVKAQ